MSSATTTLSDSRLTRRAARGSSRALEAIFERYHQDLYRYCAAIVGNSADAQDAVQNTMVKVLRALPGERREIELKPWLYRIAHNEAIEIVRRRVPVAEIDADSLLPAASAADEVVSREGLRRVLADVAELPERQRGALVMRELSGLDFEEIGAALGTSAATARQTLYEARLGLRAMGEGREMDCAAAMRAISNGDRRLLRGRKLRSHLRSCEGCRAFRAEIEQRGAELALVAPLPAAAAAGILHAVAGGAAGSAAGSGSVAAGTAGAVAGKTALGAAALKAAAVGAVVALGVTAADRGGLIHVGSDSSSSPPAKSTPAPPGARPAGADGSPAGGSGRGAGDAAARRSELAPRHPVKGGPGRAAPSRRAGQHAGRHAAGPAVAGSPAEEAAPAAEAPPHADNGRHLGQSKQHGPGHTAAAAGGDKGKSATAPGQAEPSPGKSGSAPGNTKTTTGKSDTAPGHTKPASKAAEPKSEPSHPQSQQPRPPPASPPAQAPKTLPEAAGGSPAAEHSEPEPAPAAEGAPAVEPPPPAAGKPGAEVETP